MFWIFLCGVTAVFLFVCVSICLLLLAQYIKNVRSPLRSLQGFNSYNPIFGNLNYGATDDLMSRWLERLDQFGGHPYRFYSVFGLEWVCVMNAADAKYILSNNSRRYCRITKIPGLSLFDIVVGETSMLLNDGDLHRKHKNLCSPAFRPSNIRRLFPLVHNCCAHLVDYWKRRCDQSVEGVLVREDIRSHISRVTLSVIGLMAFGLDFDCIGDRRSQLSDHFEKIMAVTVVWRPWYVLPFSAYFPHPMMRNFWVGLKGLETSLANIVSWHGEQKSPLKAGRHGCLLEMILETSSKEPHQSSGECSLSPTELRDEMMTFLMAGHETSSLGLTWALYLLAKHPNIQQKCFEEARNFDRSTIDTDQNPLEQLKYIEAVVYESLRLYPPVPNLARRTTAADVLPSKVQLPRGTRCVINVAMIHRNADDWADPDSFRPERFLESDVPLHAFFPFGDGPYKCIGYRLALAEMILMLSILVVAFRFELPPGEKDSIKIKSAITLQPANPVRLNIFHR